MDWRNIANSLCRAVILNLRAVLACFSWHDLAFFIYYPPQVILMDALDYKKMAEQILNEIASLEIQQEETERRIVRLKQVLIALTPLAEEPILPFVDRTTINVETGGISITDATRQIFQVAKVPLAPAEIKQQLLNMGKDLSDQKNVMVGLHSLLTRLVALGEIETRDNGLTYQSKGMRVLLSPPEPRQVYVEPRKLKRE
jgi:hypothetical protein